MSRLKALAILKARQDSFFVGNFEQTKVFTILCRAANLQHSVLSSNKEENNMPNIQSISSLRNYNKVLEEVHSGEPVFLTKNGTGRYAVIDLDDYNMFVEKSWQRLFSDLRKSRARGEEEGWITQEQFDDRMDTLTS